MKKSKKRYVFWLVLGLIMSMLMGCQSSANQDSLIPKGTEQERTEEQIDSEVESTAQTEEETEERLAEDGHYISKEEVAAYLHQYEKLPSNYITKKEAKKLGWVSTERNLAEVAPGMSIGGDYFGNYEGLLPEADDRDYYECDINSIDGNRGAERIVYSNDGLIYYTPDHYDSFELLYGEE